MECLIEQLVLVVPVDEHRVQRPVKIRPALNTYRHNGIGRVDDFARPDWQTGGAKGCAHAHAACKTHAKPLIFDLEADPAEATALDPTEPGVAKAIAALEAARKAKMLDINSTPRTVADYSQNATGRAANCCNSSHMECSCQVW